MYMKEGSGTGTGNFVGAEEFGLTPSVPKLHSYRLYIFIFISWTELL